ncbi:hypothetical protein PHMEG_000511 [Phytophthora megakarya]|uniref:Uncharacterized protein n=1 Tax=Phytophthora megakarya TaxID=4795 RepID=A0A225X5C2_9STRA|nr:hypothetical protein PHMEG_000511 [Phytophthora megakarya]
MLHPKIQIERYNEDQAQQIEKTWRRAKQRKTGQIIRVYKERSATYNYPTRYPAHIQEQHPRVTFLSQNGVSSGPASSLYMATAQARLPPNTRLEIPNNTTFQQLQFIDQQKHAIDEGVSAALENYRENYPTLRIMLQDVEFSIRVNIHDLRSVLGLPNFSLCPPFRAPNFDAPTSATVDMEDEDHGYEEHKDEQDGLLFGC